MSSTAQSLIHDWNPTERHRTVQICDETLRDGLQGSVQSLPTIEQRLELMTYSDQLGLSESVVGFPAQPQSFQEALSIVKGADARGIKMPLGLLGRMVESDIEAIDRIRQQTGHPITAWLFVGCSPIRRYVEARDVDTLVEMTQKGIHYAKQLGLPVNYGTEDTSRAEPKIIERLFKTAIAEGAETVSICDTVGHLTPKGTRAIVQHFRQFIDQNHYPTQLDFHAHNDRGLGVANGLAACEAGIDRIHSTILGIGERAGNIPLDQMLVNMKLQGYWEEDLTPLPDYCDAIQALCDVSLPDNYPILGSNAFLTQAGVHASAILKAEEQGEKEIAALVYSGVNPNIVGLDYGIQVGPHSGQSNVRFILNRLGIHASNQQINQVLTVARTENRIMPENEVTTLLTQFAS